MSYTNPRLPNFCNIGNSSDRNKWNQNIINNNKNKSRELNKNQRRINEDIKRRNINLLNLERNNYYDRNYYRNLNGGFLPGENPSNPLNNKLLPDGPNIYSNTGTDGRLKDSKKLYYKTYATTMNLTLGILLSLYIIIKKPNYNI